MQVRDGMSAEVLTVGPDHTLREAARLMAERDVGAAIVLDVDAGTPGIVTERDLLRALAAGDDPDLELVRDHLTDEATTARESSSLEFAADAMLRGRFRHLIVVDDRNEVAGILSMRDIVGCWHRDRAPLA
ncbi:MAG: CBS domain-containing protein [Nitriliruptorales bacterium]|nr:CBS domain-containing protein [Nitriliruptorales bacterium]